MRIVVSKDPLSYQHLGANFGIDIESFLHLHFDLGLLVRTKEAAILSLILGSDGDVNSIQIAAADSPGPRFSLFGHARKTG